MKETYKREANMELGAHCPIARIDASSVITSFATLLNRSKDIAQYTAKELEHMAAEFEHLNTEMVCYLTSNALRRTS